MLIRLQGGALKVGGVFPLAGQPGRFKPRTKPESEEVVGAIEKELKKK